MGQGGNSHPSCSQENLIKLQRSSKIYSTSSQGIKRKSSDSSPPWDSLAPHRAPPGVPELDNSNEFCAWDATAERWQ